MLNIDFGIWYFGDIGLLLLYGFCFFFLFKPSVFRLTSLSWLLVVCTLIAGMTPHFRRSLDSSFHWWTS